MALATPSAQAILVTGASAGIGYAVATTLIQSPCKHSILVTGRRSEALSRLKQLDPTRVFVAAGDMLDPTFPAAVVKTAYAKLGRLDALVLNHGTLGQCERIADSDVKDWQDAFMVNVSSNVALVSFCCTLFGSGPLCCCLAVRGLCAEVGECVDSISAETVAREQRAGYHDFVGGGT